MDLLIQYQKKLLNYPNYRFVPEILVIGTILHGLWGLILMMAVPPLWINTSGTADYNFHLSQNYIDFLFSLTILGPIFETIVGQWLPIQIGMIFTKNKLFLIFVSATHFSLIHSYAGPSSFLLSLPFSFIFAWIFIEKRNKGFLQAFLLTAAVHSLYNLMVGLVFLYQI